MIAGRRAPAPSAAEDARQRGIERRLHHDLIFIGDDDAVQRRNSAAGCAQVQRPHVQQRFADRNHEQRALNHLRALLVPQRNLRRDHLVLVDARDDLARAVDDRLPRKLEHLELPVSLRIGARRHPRGQVVLPRGSERQHLNELGVRLPGQPHDRVVRLHQLRVAVDVDRRNLPLIFLVVEDHRVRHVIGREHRRLNREDRLRIAEMLPQVGAHRVERLQQARIRARRASARADRADPTRRTRSCRCTRR